MRFFAHDGKTVHGPSPVEELTRLPGFDGDTLVCPVGSENSMDWKPALAYPPFRAILLAPRPSFAPPKPAAPPARPVPPPPTKPCPACSQRNPEKARFCNECGGRMDGRVEPAPEPTPAVALPVPVEPIAPAPPDSSVLRKAMIAAFVGAAVAGGGLGWWLLRPAPVHIPKGAELDLTPPAPSEPAPAPKPADSLPAAVAPKPKPAQKPKRVRKPAAEKAAPPPAPRRSVAHRAKRLQPPVEPKLPEPEPEAAKPAVAEPEAAQPKSDAPQSILPEPHKPDAPKAPDEDGFLLPGIPRRVSATAPTAAKTDSGTEKAADKPAAPAAPDRAEDPAAGQVREQYDFCSQLLSQGAFADHFDTCLCSAARASSAFHGDRNVYAAAMKKLAAAGGVKVSPPVGPIVLSGATATVKTPSGSQRWALEDGLWCRAP